ncbi:MAG: flavodoxin family protein [Bacillota bacterium]|nr:flavodoxin family protein [Bacillota bacterium]
MIVIVSDDSRERLGLALKEAVTRAGAQAVYFAANTLSIKPCAACGSCSGKTYGRCVIPDDMQQVLPRIAGCQTLVLVSPIVFGGVSSHIKKVMDRMAAVGDPRYHVSDGELVKGMTGQGMGYCMLGIGDDLSEAEQAAFLYLHAENRKIMSARGRAFILESRPEEALINKIAQEITHEKI